MVKVLTFEFTQFKVIAWGTKERKLQFTSQCANWFDIWCRGIVECYLVPPRRSNVHSWPNHITKPSDENVFVTLHLSIEGDFSSIKRWLISARKSLFSSMRLRLSISVRSSLIVPSMCNVKKCHIIPMSWAEIEKLSKVFYFPFSHWTLAFPMNFQMSCWWIF